LIETLTKGGRRIRVLEKDRKKEPGERKMSKRMGVSNNGRNIHSGSD